MVRDRRLYIQSTGTEYVAADGARACRDSECAYKHAAPRHAAAAPRMARACFLVHVRSFRDDFVRSNRIS